MNAISDTELRAVRRRFYRDFPFYARWALKIRTKQGSIAPLILNRPQRRLLDAMERQKRATGRIRIVLLKARQMGLSTEAGAYMFHDVSQNQARRALVVTHHTDSTRALFDMVKRFYEHLPELVQPSTRYSSRRELAFGNLDSSYIVATAGGEGVGRGETITHLHASEMGFWPQANATETWRGLIEAVPNEPGTCVIVESTANGVGGVFYDLWRGAIEGTNGFAPVFLPWFADPSYRQRAPVAFEPLLDEIELMQRHGLDVDQIYFRRQKIAQIGRDTFNQEYPETADAAFLTSGRPVFEPYTMAAMLAEARPPVERWALTAGKLEKYPNGELALWFTHRPEEQYTIGADTGLGLKDGDFSVAAILDSARRLAGVWRARVHPDYFAEVLKALGDFFNGAEIVVENNSHGILTVTRLAKDLAYPYVYTRETDDDLDENVSTRLGFHTNRKTKGLIINDLRGRVRTQEIEIYDEITLREMATYVVTETGTFNADTGCYDDCVIALALANYRCDGPANWVAPRADQRIELPEM